MLLERVLARWRRLVAFMRYSPTHRDDHRNGHQSGYILHYRCVDCRPGGRRGNLERVVARWRRSVASGGALVMLHRAMRSVSHRRTAMAIEMARDGGTFAHRRRLFSSAVIVAKDHVKVH